MRGWRYWATIFGGLCIASSNAGLAAGISSAPPSTAPNSIPPDLRAVVAQSARLGRLIYLLDKAAAIGTDALVDQLPENHVPIGGFLATRDLDPSGAEKPSFTVIFYTPGNEPKVTYRVHVPFKPGAAATVEEVKPPSPPGAGLETMIRARSTALAGVPRSGQPINPVVLPASLIGENGFLVYLLAGTKKPGMAVFGKHYRVLVSSDGTTVKRLEPLSRTALEMPVVPPEPGGKTMALVVSQIVTDYPLETHVFVSLLKRMRVVVATRRGGWTVDGDRIEFLGQPQKPASTPLASSAHPVPVVDCHDVCARVLKPHCPRGPRDEADCLAPCQKSQSGSCAESVQALVDCTGPDPHFTCDDNGFVSVTSCKDQYLAVLRCASLRMRDQSRQ